VLVVGGVVDTGCGPAAASGGWAACTGTLWDLALGDNDKVEGTMAAAVVTPSSPSDDEEEEDGDKGKAGTWPFSLPPQ